MERQGVRAGHALGRRLVGQSETVVEIWTCAIEDEQTDERDGREVSADV